jgi:hypothetical protein
MSLTTRERATLAYADNVLANIAGDDWTWSTVEVMAMLEDIRTLLLTDPTSPVPLPGRRRLMPA